MLTVHVTTRGASGMTDDGRRRRKGMVIYAEGDREECREGEGERGGERESKRE